MFQVNPKFNDEIKHESETRQSFNGEYIHNAVYVDVPNFVGNSYLFEKSDVMSFKPANTRVSLTDHFKDIRTQIKDGLINLKWSVKPIFCYGMTNLRILGDKNTTYVLSGNFSNVCYWKGEDYCPVDVLPIRAAGYCEFTFDVDSIDVVIEYKLLICPLMYHDVIMMKPETNFFTVKKLPHGSGFIVSCTCQENHPLNVTCCTGGMFGSRCVSNITNETMALLGTRRIKHQYGSNNWHTEKKDAENRVKLELEIYKMFVENMICTSCKGESTDRICDICEIVCKIQKWWRRTWLAERMKRMVRTRDFVEIYYHPKRKGGWQAKKDIGNFINGFVKTLVKEKKDCCEGCICLLCYE